MTTNDGCRADVRKARAEAAEVEASLIVDDAAPVTGMSNTDPTAAAVRAAQAEALREAANAARFGVAGPEWAEPVALWLEDRADRLATDTAAPEGFVDGSDFIDSLAAPVAVEGVETVETLAEVRFTDTEYDAIITALLNLDGDCAHNLAPLFRAVRSILAARIVQARAGEGALRERIERVLDELAALAPVDISEAGVQAEYDTRLRAALTTADPS